MAATRKSTTPEVSPLIERPKYRIFISYSHDDQGIVQDIANALSANGLEPVWDEKFRYGEGFHEQIRNFIAHAHVFMPVLTEEADSRKWVHQEIGFATALNIPVLPLAIGQLPDAMIQTIHALRVDREAVGELAKSLTEDMIEVMVNRNLKVHPALFRCASLPEDRARMMVAHADEVYSLGRTAVVRQKGALSSFHIPIETVRNPIWKERYGKKERSEEHCREQRAERIALQRHADDAGCKLIIDPYLNYRKYGPEARVCRLECLLRFLDTMSNDRCWVAVRQRMDERLNVTILGNWFLAESRSGADGKGYQQTMFTRHAPTIMQALDEFDAEFDELLKAARVSPEESLEHAKNEIKRIVSDVRVEVRNRNGQSKKTARMESKQSNS